MNSKIYMKNEERTEKNGGEETFKEDRPYIIRNQNVWKTEENAALLSKFWGKMILQTKILSHISIKYKRKTKTFLDMNSLKIFPPTYSFSGSSWSMYATKKRSQQWEGKLQETEVPSQEEGKGFL